MNNDSIDWTPLDVSDSWASDTASTMARVHSIVARSAATHSTFAVLDSWQRPIIAFTVIALLASLTLLLVGRLNPLESAAVLAHTSEAWSIDGSAPSGARIANVLMGAQR